MKSIILSVFVVLFVAGCYKHDTNTVMQYEQTWCTDKWGYGSNDEETKMKLGNYLNALGINYSDLRFEKLNAEEGCKACFCKTGKVFSFRTKGHCVNQLEALGFRKK